MLTNKLTIHIHLVKLALLLAALTFNSGAYAQVAFNLSTGWNLLGNSSALPIDAATTFADASKITTVWKWNKTASKWAFYAPSMLPAALTSYAQSKGYDVLSSIDPKEGFWVNASAAAALTGPAANGVTLVESDLQQGWNLAGSADNKTPSQLNQGLAYSLGAAGKAIVTAWAWDAPSSKWKFYAPALEAQGGTALADYITQKGYLPFGAALSAADGFWLNVGAASPSPAPTPFVAVPSVTTGLPLSIVTATVPPAPGATYQVIYDIGQGQQSSVALNQPVADQLSIPVPLGALDSGNILRNGSITFRIRRTLNNLIDESSFIFNVESLPASPYPAGTVTKFILQVQRGLKDQAGSLLLSDPNSLISWQAHNQTIYGDGLLLPNEFLLMPTDQLMLMDSLYLAALKGAGIDPSGYLPPIGVRAALTSADVSGFINSVLTPKNGVILGGVLMVVGTVATGGAAPIVVGAITVAAHAGAGLVAGSVGTMILDSLTNRILNPQTSVSNSNTWRQQHDDLETQVNKPTSGIVTNPVILPAVGTTPNGKFWQRITTSAAPTVVVGSTGILSATVTSNLPMIYTPDDTSICTVSGNVVTGVGAGLCIVSATQDGDATWNPAPPGVGWALNIGKGSQTLSFGTAPAVTVGGTGIVSTTHAETVTSGLPVTYRSTDESICTVTGNIVKGVAAGTCTVAANQAGNSNFNAALEVTLTIPVAAVVPTLSITPLNPSLIAGEIVQFSAAATDQQGNPINLPLNLQWKSNYSSVISLYQPSVSVGSTGQVVVTSPYAFPSASPIQITVTDPASLATASTNVTVTPGYLAQGGLIWAQTAQVLHWVDANAYCSSFNGLGLTGWRIPTNSEQNALRASGQEYLYGLYNTWSSTPTGAGGYYVGGLTSAAQGWTSYLPWTSNVACVR